MPRSLASPEHLFDRTWRPGHPFRPKLSRARRIAMAALLLALCAIIGSYGWVTDATRVKNLAQDYLSRLIGGHVTVGNATLSIFQGLRLSDVKVFVDKSESDDSLIFRAQSFLVRVNGPALLDGRVEATQIFAIEPHVRLIEDLDTGRWNHQSLRRPDMPVGGPSDHPPVLPQVILRNAVVEYGQIKSGQHQTRGSIAIDGQLQPALEAEAYLFRLQSRGATQGMGPSVEGRIDMGSGVVSASLRNFRFGEDLEAMLPAQVRQWWKDHNLAGRVEVPELTYRPGENGAPMSFRAEIDLQGVKIVVKPQEWLSNEEMDRDRWLRGGFDAMRLAGLDEAGFVDGLQHVIEPTPIALDQVTGKFVFTEHAVDVDNVTGFVESNGLKINGRIEEYGRPSKATVSIRVSSMDTSDLVIPASPRYINSMPQPVREIYDHLRPQGHCRFVVHLEHKPESRPKVDGEIDVVGGTFIFDNFPYPVAGASGKLIFGNNPQTGEEQLLINDVRGHGPAGGPNEQARVRINGLVSPFGAESHVKVTVVGDDIVSEPSLFHAFPRRQTALRMFDAPGQGQFPKFRGGFTCDIERRGLHTHWNVVTQIRLDEAQGVLVAFPYLMTGVSGELTVTDNSVKISHATMKKNGATMQIDGQVSWHHESHDPDDELEAELANQRNRDAPAAATMQPPVVMADEKMPSLKPELHVVATNVPIDDDLLVALPPDQRDWLKKAGVTGRFDLDGVVSRGPSLSDEVGFDFRIKLLNGTMWPVNNTPAVTAMVGTMRLTPGKISFESIQAKRGDADIAARGSVGWSTGTPEIAISADATNLSLDAQLREVIPQTARDAWDQVQPQGTLDLSLTYNGAVTDRSEPTTQPIAAGAPAFQLVLTPRQLSATPQAVPYKLDQLAGTVTVSPQKVVLDNMTARHGDANVRLSAVGTTVHNLEPASAPATAPSTAPSSAPTSAPSAQPADSIAWDFHLGADSVLVDDDLSKALPRSMSDLIKALQLRGKLAFEFDKLLVVTSRPAPPSAKTALADRPLDVDFALRMKIDDASLDVGVPLNDVKGATAQFTGLSRGGKLAQLDGAVDLPTLTLGGRRASNLKATLLKPADLDLLRIQKIETHIADGEMAGQFDCALGDSGPTRYAMSFVLRNADVSKFTGDSAPDLHGRLSASLALEGSFNETASRRGRGDVSVTGDKLYRIPLLLGLLQITNLSLPITSPFNDGTVRYSVDGKRVTFESIELRSKEMLMQGSGHLDFGNKEVRLTFVTDNTTWPKLPIIGDLIQGARHELLQIHVKGTLQDPKVTAGAFSTFTTTVDEVLKGSDSGTAYSKDKK